MTNDKRGVGRRLVVVGAVGVGLLAGGLAAANVANAAPTVLVQHVYNTDGEGLWMHPSSPTLNSDLSVVVPEGGEFGVQCWIAGDNVDGDNIWLYGTATATGDTGYVADFYVDTATTQGSEGSQLSASGVPQCGTPDQPAAPVAPATDSSDHTLDLSTPCQGSRWVDDLVVVPLPGGNFKIEITPTSALRNPIHANDRNITVDIWHDIQSCVPGLYGDLADSVWQQLQCHQQLAAVPDRHFDWASGPTFDFESWHPKLPNPGIGTYISTHCLNQLGDDPGPATGNAVRPGEGILDLDFGNYA